MHATVQDAVEQLLVKQSELVKSSDFSTASSTDLIVMSALLQKMEAISKLDVGAIQTSVTLAGVEPSTIVSYLMAQPDFNVWLNGVGNLDYFQAAITDSTVFSEILNNPSLLSSVSLSSLAVTTIFNNANARLALLSHAGAMSVIAASSVAMTSLTNHSDALTTALNNATALGAIFANAAAVSIFFNDTAMFTTVRDNTTASYQLAQSAFAVTRLVNTTSSIVNNYYNSASARSALLASVVAMNIIAQNINNSAHVLITSSANRPDLLSSSVAMTAIVAVPSSFSKFLEISVYYNPLLSSQVAMSVVANNAEATTALVGHVGAHSALIVSSTAMTEIMNNPVARRIFYANNTNLASGIERIYAFHESVANAGGLDIINAVTGTKHSTSVGTATLVNVGSYTAYRGSTGYGPGVPQVNLASYTLTLVITLTAANIRVGILGVNTDDGIVIEHDQLFITNADTITSQPILSPTIPTDGATLAIVQVAHNGTSCSVSVNGGTPVTASGAMAQLDGTVFLGFGEYATTNTYATNLTMAEMVVTTNASDTTGLANIRKYLGAKYGISTT